MLIPFDYLLPKYHLKPKGIVHLGASTGQESCMYNDLKIPYVVWVEAIPKVFNQLEINISKYNNQIAFNACVSDVDGKEVVFNISNNEAQSSSMLEFGEHAFIHPTVKYIDKFTTFTKRTDTLLKEHGLYLDKGWMLNADLQGSELQAIKGLGDFIHSFDSMYLEVNKKETYRGGALVTEIDEYLKQFGFERVETAAWVGDCWSDALYLKAKV